MTTIPSAAGGVHTAVAAQPRTEVRARTFTEAKSGFKTSEFLLTIVFVVGVLLATYIDDTDSLSREDGFLYAAIAIGAYAVSRGLAKLGVREPYTERDER